MITLDTIYNQDCLEGMKQIEDHSIDCIIIDPPYGMLNKKSECGRWDNVIPFEPLWAQINRIKRPAAPVVIFAAGMFTAQVMMSNQPAWKYNLVWNKVRSVGFLNAKRMPLRVHEDICIFYDKKPTYNPQFTFGAPNHSRGINGTERQNHRCYGRVNKCRETFSTHKYPNSIITIPTVKKGNIHPTEKPLNLMRYLIRTYSNPGDIVLDCCFGSGSTIVASILEHRHYIGFELDSNYFQKASVRINKEKQQLTLNL